MRRMSNYCALARAFHSSPKREPGLSRSSKGGPLSTACPACITTTRSPCMMVSSRCAIVMTVASLISFRSAVWISSSVARSTDAVASSRTRMRERLSSARAMHTNWRWPIDRLPPRSSMGLSRPSGCSRIGAPMEHASRAAHSSASVRSSKGSRFMRKVPVKSTGSCGIMASRERSSLSGNVAVSIPSMVMVPSRISPMRKSATRIEDFPAPVRPTIPTFSEGRMVKFKSLNTSGKPGR
mmetsp:Transcript_21198/g.64680  ORF Transcript_21198/g.64680 Transcript_21198/m.64680 type:complete len:239 (+) Transcript_21198:505-1221(+)|eukprot:scaffold254006_cov27-Tisochrysis_lutea.AAC.3